MTGDGAGDISNTISGGHFRGPVLQGGQFINPTFITGQAPAAPVALAQLPPLVTGFTGREAELAQAAGLLNPTVGASSVVVSAVAGLAGVGKTALAIHAGHAAQKAGWFRGGVLFIDLHGYDQTPVQPSQALDALLRALGIRGEDIPDAEEQRAGLYRSVLAQIGDPVLIIADNASAEAQVRLLLPGPGPHRVIVTSRHTLARLGARLLDVTILEETTAVALLDGVLRAARPEDDRISGDSASARRLAAACDGLPLALQITAALLIADPAQTTGELADALADEVGRLEALRYDDGSGISTPSVAAAFELSYRHLDRDAKRLFRLLPAGPGPDTSTAAAVALAGWPSKRARTVLGRLVKAHLVESAGSGNGRWQMHDLLRLYARQLRSPHAGEREQAIDRLLAYYLTRTNAANTHLQAVAGVPVSAEFTDRDEALAWLDAERPNLIAAVVMAASTGRDQVAMGLPISLTNYLSWRRRFDDLLTVLTIGRDCARREGDQVHEAAALNNLSGVLAQMRRFDDAISASQDATAAYRRIGDRRGEGVALGNLGGALLDAERFEEAIGVCQDAAAAYRKIGDRHGEGMALDNLGRAVNGRGRFDEAISAHEKALAIFRKIGDRHGEGMALDNLGLAWRQVGRFDDAISAHEKALAIFQEIGDRHGEGMALNNLGVALAQMQRFEDAISAHREAATIYQETHDRYREGKALNNLGVALAQMRRFEDAISAHREAAMVYRETGDPRGEGMTLHNLDLALAAQAKEGGSRSLGLTRRGITTRIANQIQRLTKFRPRG